MNIGTIIRTATDLPPRPGDLDSLVTAWTRDMDTGEPTYVPNLSKNLEERDAA